MRKQVKIGSWKHSPGRDIIQKVMQTLFDKVTVIVLPNLKKYCVTLLHMKVI
jgi:hypothetical protein